MNVNVNISNENYTWCCEFYFNSNALLDLIANANPSFSALGLRVIPWDFTLRRQIALFFSTVCQQIFLQLKLNGLEMVIFKIRKI